MKLFIISYLAGHSILQDFLSPVVVPLSKLQTVPYSHTADCTQKTHQAHKQGPISESNEN